MTPFLHLEPDTITDPQLACSIPYALSAYYLALPLARENGSVTVAMAYPDNKTAIAVLERLLNAEIVPVRVAADLLRRAIEQTHAQPDRPSPRVLAWSGNGLNTAVQLWAEQAAATLTAPLVHVRETDLDLPQLFAMARRERDTLVVLAQPPMMALQPLLAQSTGAMLLVRGAYAPLQRILVTLRGHASDELAMEWAGRLAGQQSVSVTLLPLNKSSATNAQTDRLAPTIDVAPAPHSAQQPAESSTPKQAVVHYRLGTPAARISAETKQNDYDLLVVAAEDRGAFVSHLLETLNTAEAHVGRPVLVVMPPTSTNLTTNRPDGGDR